MLPSQTRASDTHPRLIKHLFHRCQLPAFPIPIDAFGTSAGQMDRFPVARLGEIESLIIFLNYTSSSRIPLSAFVPGGFSWLLRKERMPSVQFSCCQDVVSCSDKITILAVHLNKQALTGQGHGEPCIDRQ